MRDRVHQHRPGGRRQLGGAPEHRVHELRRSRAEAGRLRADPRRGRAREHEPCRGRGAARRAGQALPDLAQGARPGRRGDHPHAQGAPGVHRAEVRGADRRALFGPGPRAGRGEGDLRGRPYGHHARGRGDPRRRRARSGGPMSAPAGPLLEVDGVSVRFGALVAVNRVSVRVGQREIVAIIGPNGAGKTTLLNAVSGFYHPYEGRIVFEGRDRTHLSPPDVAALGIARTFQNIALFKGMSVLDNIMTGRLLKMSGSFLLEALYGGPARRQELEHRAFVERIIDFLEIQAIRKTPAGRLPYGLQKRVELARALAAEPTLLLLDEPMAGMNVEEKEDMCRFVHDEFGTTIALIEHDMSVVMDISQRVIALDYGRKIADGTPDEVRGTPAVL